MLFSFMKRSVTQAQEIAALTRQLETAKRRITELALQNIQQAEEITRLAEYRGIKAEAPGPRPAAGREAARPAAPANTEMGRLAVAG